MNNEMAVTRDDVYRAYALCMHKVQLLEKTLVLATFKRTILENNRTDYESLTEKKEELWRSIFVALSSVLDQLPDAKEGLEWVQQARDKRSYLIHDFFTDHRKYAAGSIWDGNRPELMLEELRSMHTLFTDCIRFLTALSCDGPDRIEATPPSKGDTQQILWRAH